MPGLTPVPSGAPEGTGAPSPEQLGELLRSSSRGDQAAFARLYDATAARVHGLVLRVVRDPAQAEEVTQEAFLEIWRTAARFDPERGSAISWLLTIGHRKAVDRVRSAEASTRRDTKYHDTNQPIAHDETAEAATADDGSTTSTPRPAAAHRGTTRSDRPGVLRGIHAHGGGHDARSPGRHGQDPHPRWTRSGCATRWE